MLRILNYGGGVQSTALLLMASTQFMGFEIDHAIFADTGDEPDEVYATVEKARALCERSGIGFHIVQKGVLSEDMARKGKNKIPAFTVSPTGGHGIVKRTCTYDYKIGAIRSKMKELLGLSKGQRWPKALTVEQNFGISLDEAQRCRVSSDVWGRFVYPLIDRRMSRWHCEQYLEDNGWTGVCKSACVYCPFHSNREWRKIWAVEKYRGKIIEVERSAQRDPSLRGTPYLHPLRIPIEEAMAQIGEDDDFFFGMNNECAGVCGV